MTIDHLSIEFDLSLFKKLSMPGKKPLNKTKKPIKKNRSSKIEDPITEPQVSGKDIDADPDLILSLNREMILDEGELARLEGED